MHGISKGIWAVAFLAAAAVDAAAVEAPLPSATLTAHGSAPSVCVLGDWIKDSGPGSFSGGKNAVLSYGDSDLVDGNSHSIVGGGSAVTIHAPLLCNTALTWQLTSANGALRLASGTAPPVGFSNQWLYGLVFGPYSAGGSRVGSFEDMPSSDGAPFDGDGHGVSLSNSLLIARFGLTFEPLTQSGIMMAGSYSETFTLTMSPTL